MIRVDTYNDYKIILLKLIKNKSLKMLEDVINDDKNIEYREMLKSDDIVKNKWVNDIFKMDDKDLCDIILNLFEIQRFTNQSYKWILHHLVFITSHIVL